MAKSDIAILIVNGDVNTKFIEQYLNQLNFEPTIYCVDGAFNKIKYSKYILSHTKAVIGDFDSADQKNLRKFYPEINTIETIDQDYTDTDKAISHVSRHYSKVIIFGISGGEMDHCLGNISTILRWYKSINIEFIDEYSKCFVTDENIELDNVIGKMISVVPLFFAENITYSGLKYKLQNERLDFKTKIGTRNYAINDIIRITFSAGILMIFVSHKLYHGYLEEIK
ncbi:MAG: thiamine pyrophosphokinase [Francisellaceae bacterium]|jgi:thiamine pyrophosphokinase